MPRQWVNDQGDAARQLAYVLRTTSRSLRVAVIADAETARTGGRFVERRLPVLGTGTAGRKREKRPSSGKMKTFYVSL
jgi:D-serine deaminase-like pyridoxal phosphate-dependent protein